MSITMLEAINSAFAADKIKLPRHSWLEDMMSYQGFPESAQTHAQVYSYAIDYAAFKVTREDLISHELLRVVDWEEGDSGLYHFYGPPAVDYRRAANSFTEEAIARGWLRVECSRQLYSTGLGRCIAELHRNWG